MPWWLWTIVAVVGVVALAGLVLWVAGRRLPEGHVVSATVRLEKPVAEVWRAIAGTAGVPSWDHGVDRVERLPDREGHETWRWTMGRNSMVLVTTRSEPPSVLVRTIADEANLFSGDWTYELADDGGRTAVTLTEHGRVHAAIPRAMMRYVPAVADPALYLKRHMGRLAAHFGGAARIEVGEYRSGD